VGVEFLDPITPQYIADTVAWGAIGARTVESQVHRQLSSGLSMPIGMKNRPDGSISTAIDAINAAAVPHVFPGIDFGGTPAILHTSGNADCHLVLRGGDGRPNYGPEHVAGALGLLRKADLPERLVIDCSHGNSGKDHLRQPGVADEVGQQIEAGERGISGVMLESFLVPGRQNLDPTPNTMTYGQSVTDACMGWDVTVETLTRLAAASTTRRG
jgi:3-deoxy-7-phosphoheptulonate synthase